MSVIRQELYRILESLPDAALAEITNWLKRQWLPAHTNGKKLSPTQPPYTPVALGGLWQGISISENQLKQIRAEMWRNFGEATE